MARALLAVVTLVVASCAGRPADQDSDAGGTANSDAGDAGGDGATPASDGGMSDGSPTACGLAAPARLPCLPSSQLGKALPVNVYGALEAELVTILPPGAKSGGCPSDDAHVHLQVEANGARYDIAIDDGQADGVMFYYEATLPATAPAEGWSTTGFDYKTDLGVGAAAFTSMTPAATDAKIVADLAQVSRLTIHGMSYSDGTGAHDVHYNGGGRDGVLLLHGLGAGCGDKAVALHFKSDTF
jgi:hypothetical protein